MHVNATSLPPVRRTQLTAPQDIYSEPIPPLLASAAPAMRCLSTRV